MSWGEAAIYSNRGSEDFYRWYDERTRVQEARTRPDDLMVRVVGRTAMEGEDTRYPIKDGDAWWVTESEVKRDGWVTDKDQTLPYGIASATHGDVKAGFVPWLPVYCAPAEHEQKQVEVSSIYRGLRRARSMLATQWGTKMNEPDGAGFRKTVQSSFNKAIAEQRQIQGNEQIVEVLSWPFPAKEDFEFALNAVAATNTEYRKSWPSEWEAPNTPKYIYRISHNS